MSTKSTSHVQALIQSVLDERAARGTGIDFPDSKVTLRLSAPDAFWLAQLAELMEATRTRTASQLLSAAIRDAAQTANLPLEGPAFRDALQAFMDREYPLEHEHTP